MLRKDFKEFLNISILSLLSGISIIGNEFGFIDDSFKYLKYLPLFLGLIILYISRLRIKRLSFTNEPQLFAFAIIIISTILRPFQFNEIVIFSLIFIFASIFPFIPKTSLRFNLKLINSIAFIGFIFTLSRVDIQLDFSIKALVRSETSTAESNILPFIYGLFFIYWLIKKNSFWSILNALFILITFKRIVFFGAIVSSAFLFLPQNIKNCITKPSILILFNLLFVLLSFYISTDSFDSFVYNHIGIPAGHFTAGRSTFIRLVLPEILKNPFNLGIGIGQDNLKILLFSKLGYEQHFHNDIIKLFIEHGLIIFMLFLFLLYRVKKELLIFPIFLNICLFTDNILTYTPVIFCFLLLIDSLKINQNVNHLVLEKIKT